MASLKLFFIAAVHPDDLETNLDLFVWHTDKYLAVSLWRAWVMDEFGCEPSIQPDRVFVVPCDVPAGQKLGMLEWHKDICEA